MGIHIFQDVDHLYNCKGSFASGLAFASTDITRRLLDTESSELPASSCGPILFSPTHLLRLIDHRYVLANSLSQPSPPQVLQNNQFKLTQVLQSLLRTSAGILAMALRDEELFLLYDSLELQRYSLTTCSWHSFRRLPLSLFSLPLPQTPSSPSRQTPRRSPRLLRTLARPRPRFPLRARQPVLFPAISHTDSSSSVSVKLPHSSH